MEHNSLDRAPEILMAPAEKLRRCAMCKVEKPRSDFLQSKSGYIRSYCRPCDAEKMRLRRERMTPEQIARALEYQREYRAGKPRNRKTKAEKMGVAHIPGHAKIVASSPEAKEYQRKYYLSNKDRAWVTGLRIRFSMTPAQYDHLLKAQGGVCAICHKPDENKRLSVDHDHGCCDAKRTCGKCIRGLLCTRCNSGIGYFQEDEARLMDALAYIRNWKR